MLLIPDGDVAPSIAAAQPGTGVDLLMGVGGTPEGVLAASALKCVGGVLLGKLWPRNDEERQKLIDAGYDLDRVLSTDDLVGGERSLLRGHRRHDGRAAARRSLHARRRGHGLDRHALEIRDRPPDRGPPFLRKARGALGPALPDGHRPERVACNTRALGDCVR